MKYRFIEYDNTLRMSSFLRTNMYSVCIVCVCCEQDGEDAAQFANRVKSAIAHQGGLLDLAW